MIGGILGITLGWVISVVVSQIAMQSGTPLEITVTANSVLLATLFSAAVGIFFGYYPANRAASQAPVEALRYE
jgi:putative ABC transport system permease protein